MQLWPRFSHTLLTTCSILLIAVLPSAAQSTQPIPVFTSNGIGAMGRSAKVLAPGMVLMLYGSHLSPDSGCGQPATQPALELCGVRVLIDATPAELLYVSSNQINFKIPTNIPADGFESLRVCAGTMCSAPAPKFFSTRTALLSLDKTASVHMPVWITVDPPPPYFVSYPCWNGPWMPPGYEFEVRRDDRLLAAKPQPLSPAKCSSVGQGLGAPGPNSLPLHLLYRFDDSGTYAVRFTARKDGQILYQSEWTDIVIAPASEDDREDWLRSVDLEIMTSPGSVSIVSEIIPSLLAWPDAKSLAILMKIIPAKTERCSGLDCTKLDFGKAALAWFEMAR